MKVRRSLFFMLVVVLILALLPQSLIARVGVPLILPDAENQVVRVSGSNRFLTSIAISEIVFPKDGSADVVILTCENNFPDALAGVPLAYGNNGPILLTRTGSLHEGTVGEITRVLAPGGTIYILGGEFAINNTVKSELEALDGA